VTSAVRHAAVYLSPGCVKGPRDRDLAGLEPEALETVNEARGVEVNEQSDSRARHLHVGPAVVRHAAASASIRSSVRLKQVGGPSVR
jgi:hypothetical protein